jgi:release factor glutamine methyltransferase
LRRLEFAGQSLLLESDPMVWEPTTFARHLARHLKEHVTGGQRVLDVGTGSGVLSVLCGLWGAEVAGLDVNERAVELAARNWANNGLPVRSDRFQRSDRFAALSGHELSSFDLVVSNPPVLPAIDEVPRTGTRDDFEVAGSEGRLVLDAVLAEASAWLRDGGRVLTMATSLQGWSATRRKLDAHWGEWSVLERLELELTPECTDVFVNWWRNRQDGDGERRLYRAEDGHAWLHDVWVIAARLPRR